MKSLIPFTFPLDIEDYIGKNPLSNIFDFEGKYPKIDMKENESQIKIKCELPGMSKDNISIEMKDNTLILSGEKKEETVDGDERFHRTEITYGKFYRSIYIPADIDSERIEASFKDGILKIVLPKSEIELSKKIDIK